MADPKNNLALCRLDEIRLNELNPEDIVEVFYRVCRQISRLPEKFRAPLKLIAWTLASSRAIDLPKITNEAKSVIQACISHLIGEKQQAREQLHEAVRIMGYESAEEMMRLFKGGAELARQSPESLSETHLDKMIKRNTKAHAIKAEKTAKHSRN